MSKYIIKVLPGADCHPEYVPDAVLQNGIEAEGFLIIRKYGDMKEADNCETYIHAMSIMEIASHIAGSRNVLRQAAAIAEGLIKASEIDKEKRPVKKPGIEINADMLAMLLRKCAEAEDEDDGAED